MSIDGLHLLVDGIISDSELFAEQNLRDLFEQLAANLDMTIILGPIFKHIELDPSKICASSFEDDGGISGFCMISTSHISIHVWPNRGKFMMDIFSCKQFDDKRVLNMINEYLKPLELKARAVHRNFLTLNLHE